MRSIQLPVIILALLAANAGNGLHPNDAAERKSRFLKTRNTCPVK